MLPRRPLAALAFALALAAPVPAQDAPPAPWLRGATCYEIFVRSFADADGDGIGDLRGLTARLDHLRGLGVRCLWLTPITKAPSYHGYDPSDHYTIAREYGTDADMRRLVDQAHRAGIRVLVDMVLNHVSSEYPPFQAALRDTASPYRGWFRFAPSPGPTNQWGGTNWHRSPRRDEWYYGFFWSGMPDLNHEHPGPRAEMRRVATHWLRTIGVDGFRLDAVKYLVEDGDRLDDTPATHRVLAEWQRHVKRIRPSAWNVGEVFDSTTALLPYYPGQLDAYFAFEVSDSILAGVRRGDGRGLLAPMLRLQDAVPWWRIAPFLRNHDQSRTATVLGGDLQGARLAAAILLTLPGVPFVYYGEELGMQGDKPDERIRTPMPWRDDAPHAGFTTGRPWQPLAPDSLVANVAVQRRDSTSLLAWYRSLVRLRAAHPVLASGRLVPVASSDPSVAAWLRVEERERWLVVASLGRDPLAADLVLRAPADALVAGTHTVVEPLVSSATSSITVAADGAVRLPPPAPRSIRVLRLGASGGALPLHR
ncbi:MAG: alpha-amylase family glycosyl hydrolase [Gemmatimonadaceae bacterium]|nr:alpha-amylase family glycosyl hydrolase [Gemmatimonadaceae bacterium]